LIRSNANRVVLIGQMLHDGSSREEKIERHYGACCSHEIL